MTVCRTLLRSMLVVAALAGGLQAAFPDEWRTTSSLIGVSKYGDNFQHYDYVNPNAPKGGTEKWTYDNINHFITSPKKFVKGTAMGFAGLPKDEDRANVIAYLRTLSDNPKPLPTPGAAADATAPAKPAEGAAPAKPAEGAAPAKPAEGAAPAAPAK